MLQHYLWDLVVLMAPLFSVSEFRPPVRTVITVNGFICIRLEKPFPFLPSHRALNLKYTSRPVVYLDVSAGW